MSLNEYDKAINLLAEYAKENLPDGYTIILSFRQTEAWMEIMEFNGENIDGDYSPRGFVEACEVASEHNLAELDQAEEEMEGQP